MKTRKPRYRLPAEWESHAATLLCWPSNPADWPGKFTPIHWVYAEIIRLLTESEKVILLVRDARYKMFVLSALTKNGYNEKNLVIHILETDRNWMRDSAPVFVLEKNKQRAERRAIHFRFNGWAKYSNWKKDARIPRFVSGKVKDTLVKAEYNRRHVVLEGGAIDSNGQGTLLTTEECLLDPLTQIRNPGFSRQDYEDVFREYLGIQKTIWLGKGIAGDDTHGHVDDLCRFVNPSTVVLCREKNSKEENYSLLEENFERLRGECTAKGESIEVISLPMPRKMVFDGLRVPASYANFYIANSTVLVPTFNDPNDRTALGILSELFPEREVCGVSAVDLIWGLGTLHCLSHEIPAEQNY